MKPQAHIIGAGPAGLTAARELADAGWRPIVLEMSDYVGGISRTESYKGFRFDIGGHRFYTKVAEVEQIWRDVLGEHFVRRPRMSRIYYGGKFYHYPIAFFNTLGNLGIWESGLSFLSYIKARIWPRSPEETFEDWVINRFGRRLFDKFFRTYTEKVWGLSVSEIRADWAAQRIKDLSFRTAVTNALFGARKGDEIKTLINQFDYPRLGPGMMWEYFQEDVEQRGGEVRMNTKVTAIRHDDGRVHHIDVTNAQGRTEVCEVDHLISSMPLRQLVQQLDPPAPDHVMQAAGNLKYRDFIMVCLMVNQVDVFPDNWIYIHSSDVRVGRIQNFKNWSIEMVPDASQSSLGMEYFCNQGDDLWQMQDSDLIALATEELYSLGLLSNATVYDGMVIRQPKAYPVYDAHYLENLQVIREYLDTMENLQTVGRNGMHRYNNQDHSMLTGLLAARNLLGENHDLWVVNTERSYYETFQVDGSTEHDPQTQYARLAPSDP